MEFAACDGMSQKNARPYEMNARGGKRLSAARIYEHKSLDTRNSTRLRPTTPAAPRIRTLGFGAGSLMAAYDCPRTFSGNVPPYHFPCNVNSERLGSSDNHKVNTYQQ